MYFGCTAPFAKFSSDIPARRELQYFIIIIIITKMYIAHMPDSKSIIKLNQRRIKTLISRTFNIKVRCEKVSLK